MRYPIQIVHSACRKPAFLLLEPTELGDVLGASQCAHLDGHSLTPNQRISCDSCGAYIDGLTRRGDRLIAR
jgi:hypothetical protein